MSITVGGRAPYAPFASIERIIDRHVKVGLPGTIDMDMLERIGISEALRPRTLASVKLLNFCDDDGQLAAEFDTLKRVAGEDVPAHLGAILKEVYAPVFEIIGDPAEAISKPSTTPSKPSSREARSCGWSSCSPASWVTRN